jgi:hypothetical protein
LQVKAGEVLDFVVEGRKGPKGGSFAWAPVIELTETKTKKGKEPARAMTWDAARDFSGPVLSPPTAWEKYAHVLLMSNEFLFVD